MAQSWQSVTIEALEDTAPFLVISVFWTLVMLVVYGVFLATKPADITYNAWVHASVFLVPMIAFLGQILHQALKAIP